MNRDKVGPLRIRGRWHLIFAANPFHRIPAFRPPADLPPTERSGFVAIPSAAGIPEISGFFCFPLGVQLNDGAAASLAPFGPRRTISAPPRPTQWQPKIVMSRDCKSLTRNSPASSPSVAVGSGFTTSASGLIYAE